jgi:hypothetical protein
VEDAGHVLAGDLDVVGRVADQLLRHRGEHGAVGPDEVDGLGHREPGAPHRVQDAHPVRGADGVAAQVDR